MDAEFFDTDICNAIYELKHIAKSGKLEITPAIIALCNAEVTPVDARDILMKTENGFRKILVSYFHLYDATDKENISFFNCQERLAWLLFPYGFKYFPLEIVRLIRNKVHSERKNPKTQQPETDALTGKILFDDRMLPDDEVLALEAVKFIVFSYIGVIAVVRKFIEENWKNDNSQHTDEIIEKIIDTYHNIDKKLSQDEKEKLKAEYPTWLTKLKANAEEILAQYDSHIKINLDIHSESKVTSVKWRIDSGEWNEGTEILSDRYKKLEIEVVSGEDKILFTQTITARHRGNIFTLVLDCEHMNCEVICDSVNEDEEEDYKATIKVSADLDCTLEIASRTVDVKRGEVAEVIVFKGTHSIILTAKNNPSYKIAEDIEVTRDSSYQYCFAQMVSKHREWWNIKDLIVLKRSKGAYTYAVLWDKSVGMTVREYKLGDSEFYQSEEYQMGFTGNLCDDTSDMFHSKFALPFDDDLNFDFVISPMSTFRAIDENGKTLYELGRFKDWQENNLVRSVYFDWRKKFQFSERRAAVIENDGECWHFVTDTWKRVSESYSYTTDNYPVFRNGYCAVKKGEEGYLFLKDTTILSP